MMVNKATRNLKELYMMRASLVLDNEERIAFTNYFIGAASGTVSKKAWDMALSVAKNLIMEGREREVK